MILTLGMGRTNVELFCYLWGSSSSGGSLTVTALGTGVALGLWLLVAVWTSLSIVGPWGEWVVGNWCGGVRSMSGRLHGVAWTDERLASVLVLWVVVLSWWLIEPCVKWLLRPVRGHLEIGSGL